MTQLYLTPSGMTCRIIRETKQHVTLLITDPDHGDHEWTTDRKNFETRYKKKDQDGTT
jgi:hypothetical protein